MKITLLKKILRKNILAGFNYSAVKRRVSFTLLEVMIATAILSIGAIFIHQAFFMSLDAYSYCKAYLNLGYWMEEKIWETQDNLLRFGSLPYLTADGVITQDDKKFKWNLSYALIDQNDTQNLFEIDLVLSWREGIRQMKLRRSAYALYIEKN